MTGSSSAEGKLEKITRFLEKVGFSLNKCPFQYNLFLISKHPNEAAITSTIFFLWKLIWLLSCVIWETAFTKHLEWSPFQKELADETHPLCNIERGPATSTMVHTLCLFPWVNARWNLKTQLSKSLPMPIRSRESTQKPFFLFFKEDIFSCHKLQTQFLHPSWGPSFQQERYAFITPWLWVQLPSLSPQSTSTGVGRCEVKKHGWELCKVDLREVTLVSSPDCAVLFTILNGDAWLFIRWADLPTLPKDPTLCLEACSDDSFGK